MKYYYVEIHGYGFIEGHVEKLPVHVVAVMNECDWEKINYNFKYYNGPITYYMIVNDLKVRWNNFSHLLKNTKVKELTRQEYCDLKEMFWKRTGSDYLFDYLLNFLDNEVMVMNNETKDLVI